VCGAIWLRGGRALHGQAEQSKGIDRYMDRVVQEKTRPCKGEVVRSKVDRAGSLKAGQLKLKASKNWRKNCNKNV
jgi:hypothetical protein